MNQGKQLVADGPRPRGESYVERRHRTLTELKRTVQRHPAVDIVYSSQNDDGRFRELAVSFSPLLLDIDANEAGLRIAWRPRPDPSELAYFVFHYHDSTGRDFGWHREPNPHVDGLEHYPERNSPDKNYESRLIYFESSTPVALCWDILGRIERHVRESDEKKTK